MKCITAALTPSFCSLCSVAMRLATTFTSAFAASIDTPGFSSATIEFDWPVPRLSVRGSSCSGSQTAPSSGKP